MICPAYMEAKAISQHPTEAEERGLDAPKTGSAECLLVRACSTEGRHAQRPRGMGRVRALRLRRQAAAAGRRRRENEAKGASAKPSSSLRREEAVPGERRSTRTRRSCTWRGSAQTTAAAFTSTATSELEPYLASARLPACS